ncbi:ABC transporter ATP-binding protein [Ferrovibrio sp.]|uniref:ABC transporter ATP-binding protein n=1 Tax=Ferrovibrio sp. TaxID=1917215 RepID=UPI001B52B283|nr:ABC transporter ATP-binding protein [Ferrovibrio sp.]MBP7064021.1 ABC transporter ATP-binding protein [Ferrovibrio sp.]
MSGVSIADVRFSYGAQTILDNVCLEIERGEFFAFLGPSGSGKTTLLRLVAGFGMPDAGTIRVGSRDVTTLPPWQRNVGMVFQSYALWPHMTVAENVAFGLEQRKVPRGEIPGRVQAALDLVGLGQYGARRPSQLSGGQQQRVALARTLVVEPEVLLLDEPLSNLDAKLREEMRDELRLLQRRTGLTTIFVTHDQEEANAVSDRMALLDGGRIQQIGRPVDLYDRPANRFVAGFLGSATLIEGRVRHGHFEAEALALALPAAEARDGAACLALRPQALALLAPAADGLPGQVASRQFLGSLVRYAVQLGPHRLNVDRLYRPGDAVFEAGQNVSIQVPPESVLLLRD